MRFLDKYDQDGKISRVSYIVECALEFFINIATTDYYLSALMTAVNISTALQGVITSLTTISYMIQLLSVLLIRKRSAVRRFVIRCSTISEFALCAVYFTPFFPKGKSLFLVLFILVSHSLASLCSPFRSTWEMSNVAWGKRGVFTAIKEIVSLLSGYLFTLGLGLVMDSFQAAGNRNGFFITAGIAVYGIAFIRLIALLCIREKEPENKGSEAPVPGFFDNLKRSFSVTVGSPVFRKKVLPLFCLYFAAVASVNFHGVYKTNILLFSGVFNSVIVLVGYLSRAVVSVPFGRIADRVSWNFMLRICFGISALGFAVNVFTVPANGRAFYLIFYTLYCIAMGGMNSGMFNTVFTNIDPENRIDALAWAYAAGGITSFFVTLLESALTDRIERSGNTFLGIGAYPQQVLSVISVLLFITLFGYLFLIDRQEKQKARMKKD